MAKNSGPPAPEGGKFKQFRTAYTITHEHDKKLPLVLLGAFLLDFVVVLGLGLLIGHVVFGAIFAVLTGALSAVVAFGVRAQKSAYAQVEGQPGAAAAALNTIRRGGWTVTPGVAVNRTQDRLHPG